MALRLALTFKQLVERDITVLHSLERGLKRYEYVPVEFIERSTGLNPAELSLTLRKLHRLRLVERRVGSHSGYRLTTMGFDCLAVHGLVSRGIIVALGDRIGTGKESDVYQALSPTGSRLVIKFHRLGRTSFKQTKRVRTYSSERRAVTWYQESVVAAEREFAALESLVKHGASVPRPIARSRHAVVTDYVEGVELYEYKEAINPSGMLREILRTVRVAYLKVGIVHGDLSEYNVLVTLTEGEEKPLIIDWPQYVYRGHPSAETLLRRDVEYIVRFFRRRYKLGTDAEVAFRYVKGELDAI